MIELDLGQGARLRSLGPADAPEMFALVENGREHFDRWLRWTPGLTSEADVAAFLESFAPKSGFHLGLRQDGRLVGGVLCWGIHARDRTAEVGYWLAEGAMGKGLATRATRATVDHLFAAHDVHRIEFWCAETNLRSRALAERLGFTLESVRRGSNRFAGGFRNHAIYARLASDPPTGLPPPLLTPGEFRALLDRLAGAWTRRDYAAAAEVFAADVHYADPVRYAFAGRAALRAFFEADEGREQRVEWHEVLWDPARQVGSVEYTYEGTHRYHGVVLVRAAAGLIARWREYQHVDARTRDEFTAETR